MEVTFAMSHLFFEASNVLSRATWFGPLSGTTQIMS
jgi:hypothetical protein